jgi:hypothetical protein
VNLYRTEGLVREANQRSLREAETARLLARAEGRSGGHGFVKALAAIVRRWAPPPKTRPEMPPAVGATRQRRA